MGNFGVARATFKKQKGAYDADPSFFYVIPRSRNLSKVTLSLTPVKGRGKAVTLTSSSLEDAAQWKYFAVHVKIPAPGLWKFQVAGGRNRACFTARFEG